MFCSLGAIAGMILGFEVFSHTSGLPRRHQSFPFSARWWILSYLQKRKSLHLFPSGSALPSPSISWTGGENNDSLSHISPYSREKKRLTFDAIPDFGAWQAVVLVFVGLVGSSSKRSSQSFEVLYPPSSRLAGCSALSPAVASTSAHSPFSLSCLGKPFFKKYRFFMKNFRKRGGVNRISYLLFRNVRDKKKPYQTIHFY